MKSFFKYVLGLCIVSVILLTIGYIDQAFSKGKKSVLKKVVMITIDGLRPDFYLDKKFNAPTLKSLRDVGAYALGVEVVFPSLTYPSHTTLITGVLPAKHGILSNTVFTWEKGATPAWYWEADKIKSPTLHKLVQEMGGETASVRWPVTLEATDVDYLVPEIFSMKGYYEGDDFDLTAKYTKPTLMQEILKHTSLQKYEGELQTDLWSAEATAFILKDKKPDFTTLHLANVDHVEHGHGPHAPEVVESVQQVDEQIKIVLNAIDLQNTCLIITGDHGFLDVSKKVSPNLLFLEKGWMTLSKESELSDWQVVAHASGAQAAVYVKNKKLIPEVEKLLREKSGEAYSVLTAREIEKWGAYPEADFVIEGQPGYTISGGLKGEFISSSGLLKGQHGFLPSRPELYTGLIMVGCGFEKGQRWNVARSVDIAPTIAQIMGIEFKGFDGNPLK